MPVEDHPVHEKVRQASDARYGCKDRVRSTHYWAPNRVYYGEKPVPEWTVIKNVMSDECRYDRSPSDPMCEGCANRGSGEPRREP